MAATPSVFAPCSAWKPGFYLVADGKTTDEVPVRGSPLRIGGELFMPGTAERMEGALTRVKFGDGQCVWAKGIRPGDLGFDE